MPVVPGTPGARYDRIGTIFSRVSGLIRTGILTGHNIPLWYLVYKAFPPKYEPRFDRPAPNIKVSSIVYREDDTRAKFHQQKQIHPINLNSSSLINEQYYFSQKPLLPKEDQKQQSK